MRFGCAILCIKQIALISQIIIAIMTILGRWKLFLPYYIVLIKTFQYNNADLTNFRFCFPLISFLLYSDAYCRSWLIRVFNIQLNLYNGTHRHCTMYQRITPLLLLLSNCSCKFILLAITHTWNISPGLYCQTIFTILHFLLCF